MNRASHSIPVSLLIDDGAPVNIMHWLHPETAHKHLIPNQFTLDFAQVCRRHGVRGKFSVLPMPCALGRIDQSLNGVPAAHLRRFIKVVQQQIAPHFDITPELLTHMTALDVRSGRFLHLFEDQWTARANLNELTDYLSLALRILKSVGLPASGFTSPWYAGITNEKNYVRAMAAAQWRIHRRRQSWYFLHTTATGRPRPWVAWRNLRTGQRIVSIPANTTDVFWPTMTAASCRGRMNAARQGADAWLASDGHSGQIVPLIEQNVPVTLLTHWQSLFSEGRAAGLRGLRILLSRLHNRYGDRLRWMRCGELAQST